ncbi:hypothetical protein [Spongiibacter tropicus]|jgi:hypothetical protein|uniref:hypothetical protein n=1 Tax=Spongiibacter tropicus TaxID=454602 RepID=UPI00115F14E1|nr:hypothetical protein [Spongiibacter tropicus]SMO75016.1 hypothetical protein SAMN06272769_111132 [Alcanivorax sp. DSM 26295]|tara:strand:+ start:308 stop:1330 length:1023 start_codon:yes stop_codon:yes gene_type:complete
MCKKDKANSRPVDRVRDSAGSLEVTTPDDDSPVTGMLTFGDGLYAVKEKGIYEIKLADQIDPERTNIHVPNTVQRVLSYGSIEPWVGSVLLTGHELLKKDVLNNDIDVDRAMLLVLEIAQNIASAKDVLKLLGDSQRTELEKYDLKVSKNRSVVLPAVNGITNRCKEFFQKSDHALDGLFKITKLFIPNIGKGGWESLQKEVGKEPEKIDNFLEVLDSILPFLRFVRNTRNCVEHPRADQRIVTKDFSINSENQLLPPSIEVVHRKTPQGQVPVVELMSQVVNSIVDIFEVMIAFLCNRKIKPITGFPVSVHMFPEKQRKINSVKYGYGIATGKNVIRFG